MTTTPEIGYAAHLSVAETAKLVRKALARTFPGYTFTVHSSSYAGGASVHVGWYDGPPTSVVDSVARQFVGGGFDGMIDMAYSVESWLEPDGTAHIAGSPGTTGSKGVYEPVVADPRSPDARLVRFGADHVLCQRDLTEEAAALISRKARQRFGEPATDYDRSTRECEVASRWLFPVCPFTFTVSRGHGDSRVVEASGLPSMSAARRVAKELERARNPRGWRHVDAHRTDGQGR